MNGRGARRSFDNMPLLAGSSVSPYVISYGEALSRNRTAATALFRKNATPPFLESKLLVA